MVEKKKYLFIEALFIAVFLFSFGMLIGVFIENARANFIQGNLAQLEVEIMDAKLLSNIIDYASCDIALNETIAFADRVFWEAKTLDKFEASSEITDSIKTQHKKYDLLRAMIWVNSINIRQRCRSDYNEIVYIYDYANPSIAKKTQQGIISSVLGDIKNEKGDKVLLISLAGNNALPSVELLLKAHNITELPTILIDGKTKITDIESIEDIKKYLD